MQDPQTFSGQVFAFGPFRLLPVQRVLMEGAHPLRLGSRALEILFALVERHGEVITKMELLSRVWPNSVVEEATLRVHIAALRKALGDGQAGVRYVENVTGQGYRFVAPVVRVNESPPSDTSDNSAALPAYNAHLPLTRMVGRSEIVFTLADRLLQQRFVTIVGPGGIGKTTVALATADHLSASYPQGVYFVDLAAITDSRLVCGTVAAAFGLAIVSDDPLPNILEFLQQRRMLIVLDNCEHVVQSAACLAERVLRVAPEVHILTTSREPLRAEGEWVQRLAPLDLPPACPLNSAEALGFSAVQLFDERARATLDNFELTDSDAVIVAEICRKLDGLPLAIELAAARVNLFGIRELATRLDDRLQLLTKGRRTALPRQQTLRATLDWSYELLSNIEQTILQRLAVFSGTFDAESASELASDDQLTPAEVLDHVTELVAKSLVFADVTGDQVVYRLLDTTRAYALEKLEDTGRQREIKRRHAEICCAWGEGQPDWGTPFAHAWSAATTRRIDDVRAALDWCFGDDGDLAIGVRLAATSAVMWFQLNFLDEYRGRVEKALEALKSLPVVDESVEMQLHAAFGDTLIYTFGPAPAVTIAFEKTLEIAERLGTTLHHRRALWGLCLERISVSDYQTAVTYAERFVRTASDSDPQAVAIGDRLMALTQHFAGNQALARRHAERVFGADSRPISPMNNLAFQFDHRVKALSVMARILWLQGLPDQALRVAKEAIDSALATNHVLSICYVLASVGAVAVWAGDRAQAERIVAMLFEHSGKHALVYWQFWAQCLALGLLPPDVAERDAIRIQLLQSPLCSALHHESLGTFCSELASAQGIARAEKGVAGWSTAELLRVKAEVLMKQSGAHLPQAEALLKESMGIARQQSALSWELRSAMSLAHLWCEQGRASEGYALLAPIYRRFTEGFATDDLLRAKNQLEELSELRRLDGRHCA